MELRNFLKLLNSKYTVTTWGYIKARMQIQPQAYIALIQHHLQEFYRFESNIRTFKGYIVIAIDGTDIHVPKTPQTIEIFGNSSTTENFKQCAMASASCAFDVTNHIILDSCLKSYKINERECALEHIENIDKIITTKQIYVYDRGYPSLEMITKLLEKGKSFVFRLNSKSFLRERKAMITDDEDTKIIIDEPRINRYRSTDFGNKLRSIGSLNLRITKIKFGNDHEEYLLSNLPQKEFSSDDLSNLYHMRWEIETMYDYLKNKLFLENFSGKKIEIIKQDFYTTIFLYNLFNDITQDAEHKRKKVKSKHEMRINDTMAVGLIKQAIILIILERDKKTRENLYFELIEEMKKYIEPIRKNRKFPRGEKPTKRRKHHINRKSSY